ncbi:MAG: hypothetical protein A3C43_11660 [Candidatus Schekmanbacteria bacterium RIFCSPHIGHO2_02_FULL_38_11]|uniref:Polysaccharide chain length determinant N-terminal domain-containing protein n=1 Tax=Candidatus Schekmanbacteria bacterium RIFCSPLOWO2_12_FULL_38_15 TaxID=1817883 RepID=A0A1F7SKU6_9BACT|nr:MAG: hypothetical protein A3H37_04450 [Candidatus Schekmanbacteria bacterium RIFCSPLOWO2_02_FULL_38_14]OGL51353.1 MAG: hypothetical protein A3C43_11660 [Candidatus Schekmanbacteria bacterium RIFCSPHIGHO2_02_FULL_38_11]OGL54406.1 MAG: hypothetical protein A3G31_12255 [Candidatus Schekmanbacteria bacterium RIFCSPLOWO2_12_FULL_38_15]
MDKEIQDFEEEINLIDYLRILKKRRKMIFNLFLASVVITAIVSLFMTKIYRAEATLMPIDAGRGLSSSPLTSAAESLPFLSGLGSRFGGGSLAKLSTLLESKIVAEHVVISLNLDRIFFKDNWDDEKKRWKNNSPPSMQRSIETLYKGIVNISSDSKKGLVSVSVDYKDPALAAKIANEFLSALQKFLNENTMTLAKKNRLNLEKQLEETRKDLVKAEELLLNFQQNKQIVELDKQTESVIKTSADIKAKLVAKKVELGVIKKFSTDANPDVIRLKDEIDELTRQVEMIDVGENDGSSLEDGDRVFLPFKETSNVGLNFVRLKREAIVQEKVYELLSQQYELARIEEAKDSIDFVVIDKAVPPEKRIKPNRTSNVMLAGITSIFIGIFLAFFLEYWENVRKSE